MEKCKAVSMFNQFLLLPSVQRRVPEEMRKRLLAANVGSLPQLLKFVRERWPDFYRRYHLLQEGSGREAMQRLWSDYLKWVE
jgi:hypothetical protein